MTLKLVKSFERNKEIRYHISIKKIFNPLVSESTNNNVLFCFVLKDSFIDQNALI